VSGESAVPHALLLRSRRFLQMFPCRLGIVAVGSSMAQEEGKDMPKGLFTGIFDGVIKRAGTAAADGADKVRCTFPTQYHCLFQMEFALWNCNCRPHIFRLET
jgi:hypothetical protein